MSVSDGGRTRPSFALPENYTGPGVFKRFLLGALVIVACSASATAVAAWHEVDRVISAIKGTTHIKGIETEIDPADAGKPQTILLMGSDKRNKNAIDVRNGAIGSPRSDTMILMRLDPSKSATALLSLPRDLKVHIPGYGVDKLNAAYSEGGARLTVRTIKAVTGLHINHVINVDFHGFSKAVNALGCAYVDVDRRYFNASNAYAKIDIQAGYQKLCGQDALSYVRYRHEDNDLVRAARQQDFLRQIKQQVGAFGIINRRGKLLHIFSKYTSSDLDSSSGILRLLKLAIASAGHPIREVHFHAKIGPSYVTARPSVIHKVVRQFLGVKASTGPRPSAPRTSRSRHRSRTQMQNVAAAGREVALEAINQKVRVFPVWFPTRLTPSAGITRPPQVYTLEDRHHKSHAAYRIVIPKGTIGEYYGLQGTTWMNPPILNGPHETRKIHGRRFDLYFDGSRLRLIAWRGKSAVYWLSNTLPLSVSNREMIAIASATRHL